MSAVCATPPHLEGATLQEIPLESLNCDGNVNSKNNRNVLQQLELRSKENNLTFENKFSDDVSNIALYVIKFQNSTLKEIPLLFSHFHCCLQIILKNIHISMDYGLILTWNVMLDSQEFSCDAIFVYKESQSSEDLMENLPVMFTSLLFHTKYTISWE